MKSLSILLLFFTIRGFPQTNSRDYHNPPLQLSDGLQTSSLSKVGIDSNKIIALTNKILSGQYVNIHSLLILRYNKLVYENYFPGYEDPYYGDTSLRDHHRDSMHECRSVTKSVVSACIGIAIAQGKVKNVNERVLKYFPEHVKYDTGAKRAITIKDLLTMSSGIEWYEGPSAETNQENAMMRSKDPVEYFFSQPLADTPGRKWNYSGGCTQTLAAIIKKTTGEEIDAFANKYIFLPLGITEFKWDKTKDGFHWCAGGLWLRSRDMAKFGLLLLRGGKWNKKQIIPTNWIKDSFRYYFLAYPDPNEPTYYGFQFWCADIKINNKIEKVVAAMGNGGQIILVVPSLELAVVVTAGNFYVQKLEGQSYSLIADNIFPAFKTGSNKK